MREAVVYSALGLALVLVYFGPAFVAIRARHPHRAQILVLDVLLGWTLLGWVGALLWAMTVPREKS